MVTHYMTTSPKGRKSTVNRKNGSVKSSQIVDLFEEDLKDMYCAEQALAMAIPKMIQNARSQEMKASLKIQLAKARMQITRVEKVFKALGVDTKDLNLNTTKGLKREAEYIMEPFEYGTMSGKGILSEDYNNRQVEGLSNNTQRQLPERMALRSAVSILEATLNAENGDILEHYDVVSAGNCVKIN